MQWGPDSILGLGNSYHMPQLRVCMLQLKISHAATKKSHILWQRPQVLQLRPSPAKLKTKCFKITYLYNIYLRHCLIKLTAIMKKNLPKQKPRVRWLRRGILSSIQRRANAYFSETLPKNCRGRNTSKLILQGQNHPDTKTRKRQHEKKKITGQYHWWT